VRSRLVAAQFVCRLCECVPVSRSVIFRPDFPVGIFSFGSQSKRFFSSYECEFFGLLSECSRMQGAQASCDGGGSGPSDTLPTPPHVSFPRRPSFSLLLYDRFEQENNEMTSDIHNSMDFDIDRRTLTQPRGSPPRRMTPSLVWPLCLRLLMLLRRVFRLLLINLRTRVSVNLVTIRVKSIP